MNNIKGSLILLLTAFIWGTAFVAQTSGAGAVGTFTFESIAFHSNPFDYIPFVSGSRNCN